MIQALHCIFQLANAITVHCYNKEQSGLLLETNRIRNMDKINTSHEY